MFVLRTERLKPHDRERACVGRHDHWRAAAELERSHRHNLLLVWREFDCVKDQGELAHWSDFDNHAHPAFDYGRHACLRRGLYEPNLYGDQEDGGRSGCVQHNVRHGLHDDPIVFGVKSMSVQTQDIVIRPAQADAAGCTATATLLSSHDYGGDWDKYWQFDAIPAQGWAFDHWEVTRSYKIQSGDAQITTYNVGGSPLYFEEWYYTPTSTGTGAWSQITALTAVFVK